MLDWYWGCGEGYEVGWESWLGEFSYSTNVFVGRVSNGIVTEEGLSVRILMLSGLINTKLTVSDSLGTSIGLAALHFTPSSLCSPKHEHTTITLFLSPFSKHLLLCVPHTLPGWLHNVAVLVKVLPRSTTFQSIIITHSTLSSLNSVTPQSSPTSTPSTLLTTLSKPQRLIPRHIRIRMRSHPSHRRNDQRKHQTPHHHHHVHLNILGVVRGIVVI